MSSSLGFWILAALLTLLALAACLWPLLRRPRVEMGAVETLRAALRHLKTELDAGMLAAEEYERRRQALSDELLRAVEAAADPAPARRSRLVLVTAVLVALGVPGAAFWLYLRLGAPDALQRPSVAASSSDAAREHLALVDAVAALRARLEQSQSTDVAGWLLLGRSYRRLEDFAGARDAFARAYALAPEDPEVLLEYAEALALSGEPRSLLGEPEALIDRALVLQPEHQRGLWLKGFARRQAGEREAALAAWNRLLQQLEPNSPVALELNKQIAELDGTTEPTTAPPTAERDSAVEPPRRGKPGDPDRPGFDVELELDPTLRARIAPDAVLFVYARAAAGPPMPLAVQRLGAEEFPILVRLDTGMSMLPNLSLNEFPEVVVGARIANTGSATPSAGDLEGLSPPLNWAETKRLRLRIERVRE